MVPVNIKESRLFSIPEVARFLGISQSTLYAMVSQHRVPFVKVGRRVLFDPVQLDKWIKHNSKMPMPEKRY